MSPARLARARALLEALGDVASLTGARTSGEPAAALDQVRRDARGEGRASPLESGPEAWRGLLADLRADAELLGRQIDDLERRRTKLARLAASLERVRDQIDRTRERLAELSVEDPGAPS